MSVTGQLISAVYVTLGLFALLAMTLIGDSVSFLVLCTLQWMIQALVRYVMHCVNESGRKTRFFTELLMRLFLVDLVLFLPLTLLLAYFRSRRALLMGLPPLIALVHLAQLQCITSTKEIEQSNVIV